MTIPNNLLEFKLDANNSIYKKASKKQKLKILEQQRQNEEMQRQMEQEVEQF